MTGQPDELKIRSATNEDTDRVKALVFGVLAEYGLQADAGTIDSDLDDIEGNYLERGGIFELIEDAEGRLLGTVGLYPLDQHTCELRKMYFIPQARGRGLGKQVMKRTLAHARRLGFRTIMLETASVLEAAIHLYTKFGFQPVDSDHLAARADQAYILNLSPQTEDE